MAVKRKISKTVHDALPDALKAEYKADGENYILDIEGDDDTGTLLRAKDREKQLRKEAEDKLKSAETELTTLKASSGNKDIATLEKSWQGKLDTQKAESDEKIAKLETNIRTNLVDNVALSLAGELSQSPTILLPHIKARLQADFDGENPTTRVLDKDGKVSALTVDELKQEFIASKEFSAIITKSKASGGAPNANNPNGLGGANSNKEQTDFSKMSPAQLAEHLKASKNEA